MPNWKKVILSGSNAALNDLTVNNLTVGGTFSGTTGTDDGDWHQSPDGSFVSASVGAGPKNVLVTGSIFASSSIQVGVKGGTTDSTGVYHSNGIPMMFHGNDPGVTPRFNFFGASSIPSGSFFQGSPVIIRSNATDDLSVEPGKIFVSGALKLKPNPLLPLRDSNVALEYELPIPSASFAGTANTNFAALLACESGSNYTKGVVKASGSIGRLREYNGGSSIFSHPFFDFLNKTAAVGIAVFSIDKTKADSIIFTPTVKFKNATEGISTGTSVTLLPTVTLTIDAGNTNHANSFSYDYESIPVINSQNFNALHGYGVPMQLAIEENPFAGNASNNATAYQLHPETGNYGHMVGDNLITSDGKSFKYSGTGGTSQSPATSPATGMSFPSIYNIIETPDHIAFVLTDNSTYFDRGDHFSPNAAPGPQAFGLPMVSQSINAGAKVEVIVNYEIFKY